MEPDIKDIDKLVTYIKEAWVNNPFPDIIFGCIGKGILDFTLEHIENINDLVDTEGSDKIVVCRGQVANVWLSSLLDKSNLFRVVANTQDLVYSLLKKKIRIVAGTLRMVITMDEYGKLTFTVVWLQVDD